MVSCIGESKIFGMSEDWRKVSLPVSGMTCAERPEAGDRADEAVAQGVVPGEQEPFIPNS
jgi:hypothetical protein